MRTLKLFVHYVLTNERLQIEVNGNQNIGELVDIVKNHFKFGASYGGTEERRLVLQYGGADLQNEWFINDINILPGSTLKCILKEEKLPDYMIYIKFRKEYYKYYDEKIDVSKFKVFDLRVKLSEIFGFPLSIFRLKPDLNNSFNHANGNIEMLDEHRIIDYGVERYGGLILETWIGWDNFLNYCIRGYSKQVINTMSSDEIIRQYQSKVALFMASHYGHYDLAIKMMNKLGARADRPVGEHPSRQWCSSNNSKKPEYLRCPIHEAVLNGQLKLVTLFCSNETIWVLEEKDGFGVPPWRLSLRNSHKDPVKNQNQKDVARFLLAKQFGTKVKLPNFTLSVHFYYNLRRWIENARQTVLSKHGFAKTSYKKRPFHKGGLVGYKVLVDGYNNNFKDYPNAYEGLRTKYSSYYFVDEEEKNKHVNPETYFRTLNTLGAFNLLKTTAIAKFSKLADGEPLKNKEQENKNKIKEQPKEPESKARTTWRRIINKVINKNIIMRNAEELTLLGYEIEGFRPSSAKSLKSAKSSKAIKPNKSKSGPSLGFLDRVKNQISREEENEENENVQTTIEKIPKNKNDKNKKNKKSERKELPQIDQKRLKSISVNGLTRVDNKNNSINNSLKYDSEKRSKLQSTSMSMASTTFLPKIPTALSESPNSDVTNGNLANAMKNLLAEANAQNNSSNSSSLGIHNKLTNSSNFSSSTLQHQTMKIYLKYCDGQSPRDIAKKCLEKASSFTNKSWLKQLQIGASMAQEQAKRRIKNVSVI